MKQYLVVLLCLTSYLAENIAVGGDALVSWVNATERTDGSPYTNPQGTRVYINDCGSFMETFYLVGPTQTEASLVGIAPGTHCFQARHIDQDGILSDPSNIATKVIDGVDTDDDGVSDDWDNCTLAPNPLQTDADADGYGNRCDGDLNNSGLTTSRDDVILRSVINLPASSSPIAAVSDLNEDGTVTVNDDTLLRNMLNGLPGPSGLHSP